jgi:hypothetical protein
VVGGGCLAVTRGSVHKQAVITFIVGVSVGVEALFLLLSAKMSLDGFVLKGAKALREQRDKEAKEQKLAEETHQLLELKAKWFKSRDANLLDATR